VQLRLIWSEYRQVQVPGDAEPFKVKNSHALYYQISEFFFHEKCQPFHYQCSECKCELFQCSKCKCNCKLKQRSKCQCKPYQWSFGESVFFSVCKSFYNSVCQLQQVCQLQHIRDSFYHQLIQLHQVCDCDA
jgi:hypothetical protein